MTPRTQVEHVILDEFREYKAQMIPWTQQTGERLATMESKLENLYGGQQPGEFSSLKKRVESLEVWRYGLVGAFLSVTTLFAGIIKFFHKV